MLALPLDKKDEGLRAIFNALKTWHAPVGDYLEFGVYRGRAFTRAFHYAVANDLREMRFFAFDSFEGLPEVRGRDAEHGRFEDGQYACSEDEFLGILRDHGVDLARVELVKGFFDRSLTRDLVETHGIKRVSVAWIDCDLYESTVPVLEFLTDIVTTGTIIAFDDWFSFGGDPDAGEIRAVDEWLGRNPDISLVHYRDFGVSGRIFVVQRREAGS